MPKFFSIPVIGKGPTKDMMLNLNHIVSIFRTTDNEEKPICVVSTSNGNMYAMPEEFYERILLHSSIAHLEVPSAFRDAFPEWQRPEDDDDEDEVLA